jgi:transcriptional regulator with XRE-family HTH domain
MAHTPTTTAQRSARNSTPVDPAAAEQFLEAAKLGARIKRLRLKRSMGLMELGKLTGLSASFLSQLETGRVVPTLRNLARLALVFHKDISYFFEAEGERVFRVQRKKDRVRLAMDSTRPMHIAESFSILVPEGGLGPCLAEFLPGEQSEPFRAEQHPGVEMVFVLKGDLCVERGSGEKHLLQERDLLYISGESERMYGCAGQQPVQALIITFEEDAGNARRTKKH